MDKKDIIKKIIELKGRSLKEDVKKLIQKLQQKLNDKKEERN